MNAKHMLKYHVMIPLAIVAVLLVVGVPLGTAFVIGMMSGCMSMMFMMMGGGSRHQADHDERDQSERRVKP
jgi:hypothetical protein